jgi:hypothetical protein
MTILMMTCDVQGTRTNQKTKVNKIKLLLEVMVLAGEGG